MGVAEMPVGQVSRARHPEAAHHIVHVLGGGKAGTWRRRIIIDRSGGRVQILLAARDVFAFDSGDLGPSFWCALRSAISGLAGLGFDYLSGIAQITLFDFAGGSGVLLDFELSWGCGRAVSRSTNGSRSIHLLLEAGVPHSCRMAISDLL